MTIKGFDWKLFMQKASIRAIKTMAQTAVGVIGSAAMIEQVDWKVIVSASILAGVTSILTSISTGLPELKNDNNTTL